MIKATSLTVGRWRVAEPPPEGFHLNLSGYVPPQAERLAARLLYNRGLRSSTAARDFLDPDHPLEDPFDLPDMDIAARKLVVAARAGEAVGICGDFDVDGLTGTAIIARLVSALGGTPLPYIPHREQDGHGVSLTAIEAFREAGARLMVTVDTGTNAVGEVAAAKAAGLETIITDHHEPAAGGAGKWARPNALAVVNPHLGAADGQVFLTGAGVALQLVYAATGLGATQQEDALSLAALGTIADGAPLRGDNRVITSWGLDYLGKTRHPGLRALLNTSRPSGADGRPDTELVSFYLAPRLNAAGRLGDAGPSLRLLMTVDAAEAEALAARLDQLNGERQRLAEVAWKSAKEQVEGASHEGRALVVVRCDSVPAGLLGPLAGRLCEAHGKPAIALGAVEGGVRGSARSTASFDIHAAVAAQAGLLQRYGGHARAAGFTVRLEDLDAVLGGLERLASWASLAADVRPAVEADAEARIGELGVPLWEFVEAMAPFGEGNRDPLFISRRVQASQVRTMGATGKHLRLTLEEDGKAIEAVGFGLGDAPLGNGRVDVAYTLRKNIWNGRSRRELGLKAVKPSTS